MTTLEQLSDEQPFCYFTTTGRVTGNPHEIEIWFGTSGKTLYMLASGRDKSNWVKNLRKTPAVKVRIGSSVFSGTARVVEPGPEDELARQLLFGKYQPDSTDDLSNWRQNALAVAIDVDIEG